MTGTLNTVRASPPQARETGNVTQDMKFIKPAYEKGFKALVKSLIVFILPKPKVPNAFIRKICMSNIDFLTTGQHAKFVSSEPNFRINMLNIEA